MKKIVFLLTITLLSSISIGAQTKQLTKEEAEKCFLKGEWLNGIKYKPHASINKTEFMAQYLKNKALWNKAFTFLRKVNLDTIRPGKYPIDGDSVFATVTENPTKDFENTKWEFHKKFIDIQMVIKGSEKMGILPIDKLTVTDVYNDKKDVGFGISDEGEFCLAEAGTFLIFFPGDAHRPNIKTEGCDKDKKIVIKVKAN